MKQIRGGNYSYPRVGHVDAVDARATAYKPFFVKTGTEYPATDLDPAAPPGLRLQDWIFPGYPLRIEEDTEFLGTNLEQAAPHTDGVFAVAPGAALVLRDCRLINVTVPDGALVDGGNPMQAREVPTGNPDRPTIWAPCECPKCAPYLVALRKMIKSKARPGFDGRAWQHHQIKAIARERKKIPDLVAADCAAIAAENAAAVARFAPAAAPGAVVEAAIEEAVVAPAVEAAERTWWDKTLAFFGLGGK